MTPTHVPAFGKDSFNDFFSRFEHRYIVYKQDPLSTHEAEAFCIVANHLYKDWIEHFFPVDQITIKKEALKAIGVETDIMRDIADGTKHILLDRPHKALKDARIHGGGFSPGFSKGFNTSYLALTLKDGSVRDFEEVAARVYSYWKTYFQKP